jgi:hypothetical protein
MTNITDNDKYVLNAIFNPNYPLDFDKESSLDSIDLENQSKISIYSITFIFISFYFLEQLIEIKKFEEEGRLNKNQFYSI